ICILSPNRSTQIRSLLRLVLRKRMLTNLINLLKLLSMRSRPYQITTGASSNLRKPQSNSSINLRATNFLDAWRLGLVPPRSSTIPASLSIPDQISKQCLTLPPFILHQVNISLGLYRNDSLLPFQVRHKRITRINTDHCCERNSRQNAPMDGIARLIVNRRL